MFKAVGVVREVHSSDSPASAGGFSLGKRLLIPDDLAGSDADGEESQMAQWVPKMAPPSGRNFRP